MFASRHVQCRVRRDEPRDARLRLKFSVDALGRVLIRRVYSTVTAFA
jgi:hypothetical protein